MNQEEVGEMGNSKAMANPGSGINATAPMVAGLSAHWRRAVDDIPAADWDALVAPVAGGSPFLRHTFLQAMGSSGSACVTTGWTPRFLAVHGPESAGSPLWGACPVYLKSHSYGEYVFDWAWADAFDRSLATNGRRYHPKLLSAVPFSPIPGQRLLVHPDLDAATRQAVRHALLGAITQACEAEGLSSAHLLFVSDEEVAQAEALGWLSREGVQFHWQSPAQPWASFTDFLASLTRDRRKKIQQERRKVADAGVVFEVRTGPQLRPEDWAFFERCYTQTYLEHGQRPYLTSAFWQAIGRDMPGDWVMFTAVRGGQPTAASLLALDRQHRVAYGRYWGALEHLSCLHFEACYYQPIAWCIEQGYLRFEGGAQGEHKLHRGLLPVNTHSLHWLRHEGLKTAVADFLQREKRGMRHYIDELDEHCPFKPDDLMAGIGDKLLR
jgi:predicted N-acyltransferase